ncbi:diguanylate cyclase [Limimaricola pyoseonensis]|uniref:diguanylate cyclase n=1 Tax=Limimaricola pyoseonensis TaxID=521013 RepID=A0A1G7CUL9_9RHOB|nr:diguanylate cyclase [Limimaricola pyoseonensis]SDE42921.1 response regulator receiver modulated diguanylate cyclase [Limimaricola pyoseonensis]
MPGRILIIDRIATAEGDEGDLLTAAGYEVRRSADEVSARADLHDFVPDLLLLRDDGALACVLKQVTALRARPGAAGLPLIHAGRLEASEARIALLRAGVDEVARRPLGAALLQARIRNLLRARDTAAELSLRQATHRALGFAEAPAGFVPAPGIALIGPEAAPPWATGLPGRPRHRPQAHRSGGEGPSVDLFVIDAAALRAAGEPPEAVFRIVSDLRSRSATRRAALLVRLPDGAREAALLLDLGADDLVPASAGPEEVAHRARRLIALKAQADQLRAAERFGLEAAAIDELTGLWNRRYALNHLTRMVEVAQRGRRPLAVLLLDIDHFKVVNDRHGHAAGDQVLALLAERLRDGLRPADLVARIGGEEFLVAMPDTRLEAARRAAERLRRSVRDASFELSETPGRHRVTVSVGVATGPGPGLSEAEARSLMRNADKALYAAKAAGRNRVTVALSVA